MHIPNITKYLSSGRQNVADPDEISISLAKAVDIPGMCAVLDTVWRSDPFALALASAEAGDTFFQYQGELSQISLSHGLQRPGTKLLVAKSTKTGQVVGFCGFREDAGKDEPRQRGSLPWQAVTNDRLHSFLDQIHELRKKHVPGPHLACEYMFVLRKYQHQGIGERLLVHALSQLGLQEQVIFLRTPAAARDLFSRHGWREVDTHVVDLVKWAGKLQGYGPYCHHIMVREPGELVARD